MKLTRWMSVVSLYLDHVYVGEQRGSVSHAAASLVWLWGGMITSHDTFVLSPPAML